LDSSAGKADDLGQRGNPFAQKLRLKFLADVQLLRLPQGQISQSPTVTGHAHQIAVMQHH
jgi:hypothetical protein